ncbi:MAG: alginate export family protein [Peristeroidobacter soli]
MPPNNNRWEFSMTMDTRFRFAAIGLILAAGAAQADGIDPIKGAFGETKYILDTRLRVEQVDQDPLAEDADALTLRVRLGFETGKAWNTSLLVEGDAVMPLIDDYRPDPAVADMVTYPVVADAEAYEFNRFQFTNTSLPGTTMTLGRQRILLDDQRFVGNSGWRQNEQTFDAFRVVNRSVANLVLDATFLNRVNRVNGPDSPQGTYKGDGVLLNAGYQTKIGKLSAFGYLLDFDPIPNIPAGINPLRDSTSTYGLRFTGEKPVGKIKLAYAASYAEQTDYGDNPLNFDLAYEFVELTGTFRQFSLGVGTEIMEGNGLAGAAGKGFATPLASLHKFQGWADKFLTTPANGIEDLYATAAVNLKGVGGGFLDTLGFIVSYHDYDAEAISADYGSEWDTSIAAKHQRFNLLLKYADYQQGALVSARTTSKLWAQLEFVW